MVDDDLFDRVVLEFDYNDHGVVLLVVDAMEITVCKDNGRYSAFVVRVGYVVNGMELAKMFLSS